MRIVVGAMFAMHGSQKLFGIPGDSPAAAITSFMGVTGLIELVVGVLVALGFFAGYAAFIGSGQMAVAYFIAHASKGLLPIINKGELAVLYCFIFLYIAAHGSGIWSVDSLRNHGKAN